MSGRNKLQLFLSKSLRNLGIASVSIVVFSTTSAFAVTCAEEIPEIETAIQGMSDDADKSTATHQLGKAKEREAAGKEKSCLRYIESARSAIDAAQRHDDD